MSGGHICDQNICDKNICDQNICDKRVDLRSDLKNSNVIVVVAIVGVVDNPLGGNPTA